MACDEVKQYTVVVVDVVVSSERVVHADGQLAGDEPQTADL